ncbi:unnamed protein product [Rotaria sp. Silwood1]|nr:unnamed protein product [Rotaria sp. Silwood1]
MKLFSTILLILVIFTGTVFSAPRVKIVTEYVTPNMYASNSAFTADSTVATGLRTVAKGTYVYLRAWNFGDTNPITGITWTFNSKPSGSTAVFSNVTGLSTWQKFKADLTGTYEVKVSIVTSGGSKDTTISINSGTFVGTGGFDSVAAAFPNCMSCHGSTPKFQEIFNDWKTTDHATKFKSMITAGPSSYGINQFRVHTLGYDHYIATDNNGFDDKARTLGWNWTAYAPPKSSNWDSLKKKFPSLVAFSNVGCESCHGPGSEHVFNGGDTTKIMKSVDEGTCGKCHDSQYLGPEFAQWKNARHSQVVWSSSFGQNNYATPNDLGNCVRCHDGQGYVNFTKGKATNTNGMTQANHEMVACATCHDPHDKTNPSQVRSRPLNSDTLANGFHYTGVGTGVVCLDCHKARKSADTYPQTTRVTSSSWGPHHNSQGDLFLGKNLATFGGTPYRQTQHFAFLPNACVTCHMAPTDTTAANKDKVGGHALYLHNDANDYDHLKACQNCHFGKTRFDQFIADQDYDGNGVIQAWRLEVDGALRRLRIALPPYGVDSVAWQLVAQDSNNVNLRKAYFNYLSIAEGSERGMHNAKYTIDALVASRNILTGIVPNSSEVPMKYEMSQNYPNPFNPSTKINVSLMKTSNVRILVYDITGKQVAELANTVMNADNGIDIYGKVGAVLYEDDNSIKVDAGFTHPNFGLTYVRYFGYAGESDGVTGYYQRSFQDNLFSTSASVSYSRYRLGNVYDTEKINSLSGMLGFTYRPTPQFSVDVPAIGCLKSFNIKSMKIAKLYLLVLSGLFIFLASTAYLSKDTVVNKQQDPSHIGSNPDGIAEINFGELAHDTLGGGIVPNPTWDRSTATCSNVYCHGTFKGGNTSASGIIGNNGSGKSTLIKALVGIITPSQGEVVMTIEKEKIPKELHFKHIGLMSPYLSLYDELSGYENLEFFMNLKCPDKPSNEKEEKINLLLESVGLFKRKKDLYKNYSSGMKQRLKLAFSLLNDPQLLLLDEPCANLDKEGIEVVYKFANQQKEKGMLIVATNEEADLKLCDTLLNIEDYKKR